MGSSGGVRGSEGGGGISGPETSVDNSVVRFVSTTGAEITDSLLIISDTGEGSGLTRLDVDSLRLDGNTLSATNTNGPITLSPDGTGQIVLISDLGFQKKAAGQLRVTNGSGSSGGQVWAERFYTEAGGGAVGAFEEGNISLAADRGLSWTNGSSAGGTGDTGEKRVAAATLLDTDGSTGLGYRRTGRPVEASTAGAGAPNLLAATESRKLLTNEGATAEAYHTLPTAAAGIEFVFVCLDADGIRITSNTGDTIQLAATVSGVGGYVRSSTLGSSLTLVAVNTTEWVATSVVGNWTVDT